MLQRSLQLLLFLASLCATLCTGIACTDDINADGPSLLVVEGWIEDGRFPIVKVSRTMQMGQDPISADSLRNYIDTWARVTVSDGTKEVVLVGHADNKYFPSFVYTTSELRGQAGHTYKLRVEGSDGQVAEAETTIPAPAYIDSFRVESIGGELDEDFGYSPAMPRCQLYGYTHDRRPAKLFTMVYGFDTECLSAYLGIYNADNLPADGQLTIYRGRKNIESILRHNNTTDEQLKVREFSPYFGQGDAVLVKYAAISSDAYTFWREFEDLVTLSRNPLFPYIKNLPSNLRGALGYWQGYGSTYYRLKIIPGSIKATPL